MIYIHIITYSTSHRGMRHIPPPHTHIQHYTETAPQGAHTRTCTRYTPTTTEYLGSIFTEKT